MNDITIRFIEVLEYLISEKKIKSHYDFAKKISVSNSSITEITKKRTNVGIKIIQKTVSVFLEIDPTWLLAGIGKMTKNMNDIKGNSLGDNNKIHIANGDIKNVGNKYTAESPDVLKQKINLLNELLEEKESRIKEKDSQIKEKDSQIKDLLQILKQK